MSHGPERTVERRGARAVIGIVLFAAWLLGVHAGYVWWHRARIAEIVAIGRP